MAPTENDGELSKEELDFLNTASRMELIKFVRHERKLCFEFMSSLEEIHRNELDSLRKENEELRVELEKLEDELENGQMQLEELSTKLNSFSSA
jgi:predicted nuclease with TOPRIM domain